MPHIELHFSKPTTIVGELILWRTGDRFSHSWIVIDGVMYDPLPIKSKRYEPPHTEGDMVFMLLCDAEQKHAIKEHCEAWVGTRYDMLAIFGWLIGFKYFDHPDNTYCHEFLYEVLSMLTDIHEPKLKLISATDVIDKLFSMGAKLIKDQRNVKR